MCVYVCMYVCMYVCTYVYNQVMSGSRSIQDDHDDSKDPGEEPNWSLTALECRPSGQEVQKAVTWLVIDEENGSRLPPWPGSKVAVPIGDADAPKDPRPEHSSRAVVLRSASKAKGPLEFFGAKNKAKQSGGTATPIAEGGLAVG